MYLKTYFQPKIGAFHELTIFKAWSLKKSQMAEYVKISVEFSISYEYGFICVVIIRYNV